MSGEMCPWCEGFDTHQTDSGQFDDSLIDTINEALSKAGLQVDLGIERGWFERHECETCGCVFELGGFAGTSNATVKQGKPELWIDYGLSPTELLVGAEAAPDYTPVYCPFCVESELVPLPKPDNNGNTHYCPECGNHQAPYGLE